MPEGGISIVKFDCVGGTVLINLEVQLESLSFERERDYFR